MTYAHNKFHICPNIYFSCYLLRPHSRGMAMSSLHFLYLAGPSFWNVDSVCFTFPLCVVALCIMYVYLYLLLHGWLCTLYDGLLWLREWPSLVMRALDLVVWVCAQGNCRRCIFILYYVHDHCGVISLIHVTQWHRFPYVCDTHQHAWCFEGLRLVMVQVCWYTPYTHNVKCYWCTIVHQTRNSSGFSPWKWGIPIIVFSHRNLGENRVLCAVTHLRPYILKPNLKPQYI